MADNEQYGVSYEWLVEMMRNRPLAPCPFCGGDVELYISPNFYYTMFNCDTCGADVVFTGAEYGMKAIEAWNRRPDTEGDEHEKDQP